MGNCTDPYHSVHEFWVAKSRLWVTHCKKAEADIQIGHQKKRKKNHPTSERLKKLSSSDLSVSQSQHQQSSLLKICGV